MLAKIFAAFWALWGLTAFMAVVIVLTPIYAILLGIFGRKLGMTLVWCNFRFASPLLLFLTGIRMKVEGAHHVELNRTYVFVSNHQTWIDIICNAAATPKPAKFLAKKELVSFPVFGFMVKMLNIMVDRKNKESREKSMRFLVEELKRGNSVFIYPEGTRNRTTDLLKEFKEGAFRAAIAAQTPLSWQVIIGARKLNRNDKLFLLPGKVKVVFGEPIETSGMTDDDVTRLHQMVKEAMMKELIAQGEFV